MSDDKIFVFAVSNHDARYSNIVKIDEKNGNYYLSVLIAESSCLTYSATIGQNDVQELYDIVKPVNEWSSKNSEKQELLDTTWFIYFNHGEKISAHGYKVFPDNYDSVVNKIANWLIAVLKRENEFDSFSQEELKDSLLNKPHFVFSYNYYLPLSHIHEYITIEEKDNAYFVDSCFNDAECTKRKAEISKENIDRLLEILEPLIKCDDLRDRSVVLDVCCELRISYNDIVFSAENLFSKAFDFNDVLAKMKEFIIEL